jgi:rare lipoprotein A
MRQGSTSLGSLGVVPLGIMVLILPLAASASPSRDGANGVAKRKPATPAARAAQPDRAGSHRRNRQLALQAEPAEAAQRAALGRRSGWLEGRKRAVQDLKAGANARPSGPETDAPIPADLPEHLTKRPAVTVAKDRLKVVKVLNTRATWYGPGFHGKRTASGERFSRHAMTLASRHLPMGTRVRVVNPYTGKAAVARVNDRGPFRGGSTADLSQALARKIGLSSSGKVRLEILRHAPKIAKKPPTEER